MLKLTKIQNHQMGIIYRDGEFRRLLSPGRHLLLNWLGNTAVQVVSRRDPWIVSEQLDMIVKSGCLQGEAEVIDLKDNQRALVWIDGRFSRVLPPGLYAYWTGLREVRVEVVETRSVQFENADLKNILRGADTGKYLEARTVGRDCVGVLYVEGRYAGELPPGTYAFWKDAAESRLVEVDKRECTIDIGGQEIMTSDKVTLRLNASVTYVVSDAHKSVCAAADVRQSLYREVQLALRAVIGGRELDTFLTGKDDVSRELEEEVREIALGFGLTVRAIGIRDVILPGEMKDLLNKVTEAKKGAEANLIARREETAAMRSQANTAKLLAESPTLMRLRELEVLEKIASSGKLSIVLGEKGLTDRVVNLL